MEGTTGARRTILAAIVCVGAMELADNRVEAPLSAVLEAILDGTGTHPLRLGELVDRTAERGFGILLFVLGLPMLIPILPPGSSTIVGPIYAAFAVQMLSGSRHPWLPQRFRNWVLSRQGVSILRRRGIPMIRAAERLSRPRGLWLREGVVLRLAGAMVFLMGLLLLSPLPFLNTAPAFSVMLIGMGLLNRDAVFMTAGMLVGGASLAMIGLSAGMILVLIQRIRPGP